MSSSGRHIMAFFRACVSRPFPSTHRPLPRLLRHHNNTFSPPPPPPSPGKRIRALLFCVCLSVCVDNVGSSCFFCHQVRHTSIKAATEVLPALHRNNPAAPIVSLISMPPLLSRRLSSPLPIQFSPSLVVLHVTWAYYVRNWPSRFVVRSVRRRKGGGG